MEKINSVTEHIEWLKRQCRALQGMRPKYLVMCHSMYIKFVKELHKTSDAKFTMIHVYESMPIWIIPDSVWNNQFVTLAFSLEQLAFQCTGKVKFRKCA